MLSTPLVSGSRSRRAELGFAFGNLLPALALGLAGYGLPVRYLLADALIGATVLAVLGSSLVAIGRPALSLAALRVGALALLGFGLLLLAAAALSVAYLSGVHGDFGRGGVLLMSLIFLLGLPYAFVYPVIELVWIHRRLGAAA